MAGRWRVKRVTMPDMPRITIPDTSLSVSPICLGGCEFGYPAGEDERRHHRMIDAFVSAGGNFIDTAHCYNFWIDGGDGLSERTIGTVLRDLGVNRANVVIATKGGHPDAGEKYPRPARFLSPERIAADVGESLDRLRMEYVDLYYLHRDDGTTPVGEIVDALNAQASAGKVRNLGASNWSPDRVDAANAYAVANGLKGFVAVQNEWSLATPAEQREGPEPKNHVVPPEDVAWHARTGVAAIPYTATAGGYFAGREVQRYENERNAGRRTRVLKLASERNATPSQVALAYLMAQPFTVLPIIGTTKVEHMKEAMGAVAIRLTAEQVKWLEG